jgi:hypothetical protein
MSTPTGVPNPVVWYNAIDFVAGDLTLKISQPYDSILETRLMLLLPEEFECYGVNNLKI